MSRIEDESARMGALVENLLTLARLDQVPEIARTAGRPQHSWRATPATTPAPIAPDRQSRLGARCRVP